MSRSKTLALLKSNFSGKGGLEKYVERIACQAARRGHQVLLLTTEYEKAKEVPFEVVDFGRRHPSSFVHLLRFDRQVHHFLREHPPDAIFGFDRNFCPQHYYRAGNGCHAAWLAHRRQFSSLFKTLSCAINPLHHVICQMEKSTFESRTLRYIFANSSLVATEILEFYPKVEPAKIVVVHNGVEWDELREPFEKGFSARREISSSLGLDPDRYQFLFVGNEYKRKGLKLLLQALTLLPHRDFQLSVVGRDRNIEHFQREASALAGRVRFFGQVQDVKPFYQAADCLVIPSYYDPFANVTLEALAMGLYVISSPLNGGKEVLNPSLGAVFGEFIPEALAEELERAMEKPKNRASAEARRNQIATHTLSAQIGTILSYLE